MIAEVNRSKCFGYGLCVELCPSVFKLDEEGFAYVEGSVSPEAESAAREAAEACPDEAITLHEDGGDRLTHA